MCVQTNLRAVTYAWALGSSRSRSSPTTTFKTALTAFWSRYRKLEKKLGSSQVTTHHHKTQQNSARIDRIARNVVICRTFSRAEFCWVSTADEDTVLRIDRLKMSPFAGLSPPR
jgi:hypothetical protein